VVYLEGFDSLAVLNKGINMLIPSGEKVKSNPNRIFVIKNADNLDEKILNKDGEFRAYSEESRKQLFFFTEPEAKALVKTLNDISKYDESEPVYIYEQFFTFWF
jgi:hypothetical protein